MRSLLFVSLLLLAACKSTPTPDAKPTGTTTSATTAVTELVTLKRGACFGRCPMYVVKVMSDGAVLFDGERFVATVGKATGALGFSFYDLPEEQVLDVWNTLWHTSPYGDVLFAALEFYAPIVKKKVNPDLWRALRQWSERIDNWCHSDGLSAIYSRILESYPAEVYPQLITWNQAQGEWLRRMSLVSLIHYSGKHAVFLPPKKVLPLVSNCLDDQHYYVHQTADGWVLREMGNVYNNEITKYLETHAPRLSTPAFSRAIERQSSRERTRLREIRKQRPA